MVAYTVVIFIVLSHWPLQTAPTTELLYVLRGVTVDIDSNCHCGSHGNNKVEYISYLDPTKTSAKEV